MAQKSDRAQVTPIKIGNLEIEGLMNKSGEFAISVTQFCSVFQFDKNQGSRYIKSLLGKYFQFDKWCSVLHPKAVNVIRLVDFERLLFELVLERNEQAVIVSRQLIGLSLHQLFCDAFKIKFETEDRQQWLKARQQTKDTFRDSLTDALKAYGYTEPWQYGKFVHVMQARIGIADGSRDSLSDAELNHLTKAQMYIGMAITDFQMDPYHALDRYVATARALKK